MNGHLIFRDPFAQVPHACDPSALPEHPDPTPVAPLTYDDLAPRGSRFAAPDDDNDPTKEPR